VRQDKKAEKQGIQNMPKHESYSTSRVDILMYLVRESRLKSNRKPQTALYEY